MLLAKTRLVPTKQLTIPRIELNGCVLSCRLRESIQRELDINFELVIHFTDSSIVLGQIFNESSRFKTFVANRISEIHSKSNLSEWFWIASENNIADFTTRTIDPLEMGSNSEWQCGPTFLRNSVDTWPVKQINDFGHSANLFPDLNKKMNVIFKKFGALQSCINDLILFIYSQ